MSVMVAPLRRETWMLVEGDMGVTSLRTQETLKKCPVASVYIIVGGEEGDCVELI
jgi:hypothetical protein